MADGIQFETRYCVQYVLEDTAWGQERYPIFIFEADSDDDAEQRALSFIGVYKKHHKHEGAMRIKGLAKLDFNKTDITPENDGSKPSGIPDLEDVPSLSYLDGDRSHKEREFYGMFYDVIEFMEGLIEDGFE
jgi:hypothetical protein